MYMQTNIDKSFTLAVIISFVLHIFLLGPWFILFKLNQPVHKKIEAVYIRTKAPEAKIAKVDTVKISKSDTLVKENIIKPSVTPLTKTNEIKSEKKALTKIDNPQKIVDANLNKAATDPKIIRDIPKKESAKGLAYASSSISLDQVVNLNNIKDSNNKAALIKKPGFMNYYQAVRSRIRDSLDGDYNAFRQEGDVAVHFNVGKAGELKFAQVIENKSTQNFAIRRLALSGVENAAPFPPIPSSFKEENISFIITISFKLK